MALSTFTYKDLESQIRAETGAGDYANPNTTTIMRWTNVALKKIARLLQAADSPWGREEEGISRESAVGYLHDPGDGGTFTSTTKIFSGLSGLDQEFVGGWVLWIDQTNSRGFWGVIDEVNVAGTTMTVGAYDGTGALATVTSANLFVMAKKNPPFYEGANLGAIGFTNIIAMKDATNGLAAELSGDTFAGFDSNPNYDNSIVWTRAGDALYIDKGEDITSFGTLSIVIDEKPATITAVTDEIDLLPEHIGVLKDEVSRWVLNFMEETEKVRALGDPLAEMKAKYMKSMTDRAVKKLKVGR